MYPHCLRKRTQYLFNILSWYVFKACFPILVRFQKWGMFSKIGPVFKQHNDRAVLFVPKNPLFKPISHIALENVSVYRYVFSPFTRFVFKACSENLVRFVQGGTFSKAMWVLTAIPTQPPPNANANANEDKEAEENGRRTASAPHRR